VVELSVKVGAAGMAALEDAVFEVEHATHWNLYVDFEGKGSRAKGIFDSELEARAAWEELAEVAGLQGDPVVRELADADWKDSYKLHFQPWSVGGLHWAPLWLRGEYEIPDGEGVVWLDPGMAFGTGNHDTTRLCLERLIEDKASSGGVPLSQKRLVDAGCGSGILALSAKRLGYGEVSGFDLDADAARIAEENAQLNEIEDVRFRDCDLASGLSQGPYDVVLANILAVTLIEFKAALADALAPGGTLVLSGILSREARSVQEAFAPLLRWREIQVHELGEWSSVTLLR